MSGDLAARENPLLLAVFDPEWYVMEHRELLRAPVDPLTHFLEVGAWTGYRPHPLFDPRWYLDQHPELRATRENPLLHHLESDPLSSPHPLFDAAWYRFRYLDAARSERPPLAHYIEASRAERRQPNALFDPEWYVGQHPEAGLPGLDPFVHYLERLERGEGWRVRPSPVFETIVAAFGHAGESDGAAHPLRQWIDRAADPIAPLEAPLAFPTCEKPEVSIVVPAYGQVSHTLACLRAVAASHTRTSYELLLADDASPDVDYCTVLEEVPGVHVIRNDRNRGFLETCNRAARHARGRRLVFLNNDTVPLDGWLDELLHTRLRFENVGIVGSRLLFPNGRAAEVGGIVWKDGDAWNYGRHLDADSPELGYARDCDYVSAASLLIDRELFEKLGGFDERYRPGYYEDTDLAFRVRDRGLRVLVQPRSRVIHFEGVSSGTDPASGPKAHQVKNRHVFRERWTEALAAHAEPGVDPDRTKDRAFLGDVLVLDVCTPSPARDARSLRFVELMRLWRDLGLRVTFVPENLDAPLAIRHQLEALGVRVLVPPYIASLEDALQREGVGMDLCVLNRPALIDRWIGPARRSCPSARLVADVADLVDPERLGAFAAGLGEAQPDVWLCAQAPSARSPRACVVGNLCDSAQPSLRVDERRDLLLLSGLQAPPMVDALLWAADDVLPRVAERHAGVGLWVADVPALRPLVASREVVRLCPEEELARPRFYDRFRVALAATRFGASLEGQILPAIASGLPCVGQPRATRRLPEGVREYVCTQTGAAELAEAICELLESDERWEALSRCGRTAVGELAGLAHPRAVLAELLESLQIPHRVVGVPQS